MVACPLPDILRSAANTFQHFGSTAGASLIFVIRSLQFAVDWQKPCNQRLQCDSGRNRFAMVCAYVLLTLLYK